MTTTFFILFGIGALALRLWAGYSYSKMFDELPTDVQKQVRRSFAYAAY